LKWPRRLKSPVRRGGDRSRWHHRPSETMWHGGAQHGCQPGPVTTRARPLCILCLNLLGTPRLPLGQFLTHACHQEGHLCFSGPITSGLQMGSPCRRRCPQLQTARLDTRGGDRAWEGPWTPGSVHVRPQVRHGPPGLQLLSCELEGGGSAQPVSSPFS
jgi:hypothetical protein